MYPSGSSLSSSPKVLLVTFVTLTLLAVVAHGYLGPRYGKRLPAPNDGSMSHIVGRSNGPRTIQSRSQARFYAGSRYGGKRSYWSPMLTSDMESGESSGPAPPYDCIYVPYLGVRCALVRSEDSGDNEGESYGQGSPSLTRTSIIDSVGSVGSPSGSEA